MSTKKLIESPTYKSDDSSTVIAVPEDNDITATKNRLKSFKNLLAQALLFFLPIILSLLFGFGYLRNAPSRSLQHVPRYQLFNLVGLHQIGCLHIVGRLSLCLTDFLLF
jgi:hypothetical protein